MLLKVRCVVKSFIQGAVGVGAWFPFGLREREGVSLIRSRARERKRKDSHLVDPGS